VSTQSSPVSGCRSLRSVQYDAVQNTENGMERAGGVVKL
jgi:hypothetical protein